MKMQSTFVIFCGNGHVQHYVYHLQPWARFGGGLLSFILFWTLSFATWPPLWIVLNSSLGKAWWRLLYTWSILYASPNPLERFFQANVQIFKGTAWNGGLEPGLPRCQGHGPYLLKATRHRKAPGGKRGKNILEMARDQNSAENQLSEANHSMVYSERFYWKKIGWSLKWLHSMFKPRYLVFLSQWKHEPPHNVGGSTGCKQKTLLGNQGMTASDCWCKSCFKHGLISVTS